jgi:predicted flap endonuclease-1-like 5' DNA nuclease
MRTIYLLILLFLVACIISAELYIYQINNTGFFQAPTIPKALWIMELMAMLLVACLIGFAIAWELQQKVIHAQQHENYRLDQQRKILETQIDQNRDKTDQLQNQFSRSNENGKEIIKKISNEKDRLKEELTSLQVYLEEVKSEKSQLKRKAEQLEKELEVSVDNSILLKTNFEKLQGENATLQTKLNKSFSLPPKDDLKLINGIGPAIEKKLNGLGIYSFRQISEFTPDNIEEISTAIRFFPGRIERDNWVSQARNLEEEKRRQAIT